MHHNADQCETSITGFEDRNNLLSVRPSDRPRVCFYLFNDHKKMAMFTGLIVLFAGCLLSAAFECPRECTCGDPGIGFQISCSRLGDMTLPAGFINNVNGVSVISLHGDNITVGEDAFAHISCADGGSINVVANMVEIGENGFNDIDGCRFSAYGFIGLMKRRSFNHFRNMQGFYLTSITTVSTEAFYDIIGAGTCADIVFMSTRIGKIEQRGFSNIMNFRKILFYSTEFGELNDNSFHNLSNIEMINFSSSNFGEIMPYAFAGLFCIGKFQMFSVQISNLSNNGFSGMRNVKELSLLYVSADTIGDNLFSDVHGVVNFKSVGLRGNLDAGSKANLTDGHPCEFLRNEYPPCEVNPCSGKPTYDDTNPGKECFLNVPCNQSVPTTESTYLNANCHWTTDATMGGESSGTDSTPESTAFPTTMSPEGPTTTTSHVSGAQGQAVGVHTMIGILAPLFINMNEV